MKILSIIRRFINPHSTGLDLKMMKKQDPRNYNLDVLGSWFGGYTPKYTRKINQTISIKNQKQLNTCVCESGAMQKEPDEGVELDEQWMAAYLRSIKMMSWKGTSLEAFQKALNKIGIPAKDKSRPDEHHLSWEQFTRPQLLTQESFEKAKQYKSKSYWQTYRLETALQHLDEGHIGHTGAEWFPDYNPSQLDAPYILNAGQGNSVGGHAFVIIGYDIDYEGHKVLICKTSYGNSYRGGEFYIRFEDFSKILTFGVFFNLDIEKDIASFLSLNANKAILEKNGPKVYVIESDKKRWIPDEALMWMLEITPSMLIKDTDDVLSQVPEGESMSIKDIPAYKLEENKYFVAMAKDQQFMKDRFAKYFPEIFKS